MITVKRILQRHNLPANSFYLLELIPLIEMIWADGKNQHQEILILQHFTVKHLSRLSRDAARLEVISVEDANRFIDFFLANRPDPQLLADLKELTIEHMQARANAEHNQSIIAHCMDIAAACVSEYPYRADERIRAEEKDLLQAIVAALEIPERPAS
jgi:hypothetical protein